MEPNGEETEVKGLGTGTTVRVPLYAFAERTLTMRCASRRRTSNHGTNGKDRDRQHWQSPVAQHVSENSSVRDKLSAGAMGIARKASTRRSEKDEKELPSWPVTDDSISGYGSSTPIASTSDANLNGHHHTAKRPMTMVVPAPPSADPGTHPASSSLLHLADRARHAALTPSPSPWHSTGLLHGLEGDREDVEGVFGRSRSLGVRSEVHIVKVCAKTAPAQPRALMPGF